MAENPNYATVRDGKVVDAESGDEIELETPGPAQGTSQLSSEERDSGTKSLTNMTHAELDAYATDHQIDLSGTTTRDDKIDRIQSAEGEQAE